MPLDSKNYLSEDSKPNWLNSDTYISDRLNNNSNNNNII